MKSRLIFNLILLFLLSSLPNGADAQDKYYVPLNIKRAYEKQTRSLDGNPGKNYWQNSSNYKIKVALDPSSNLITGNEEIEYFNNSPDSLDEIVIRLYQNLYKAGAERDLSLKHEDLTDGAVITKFSFNNKEIDIEGNPQVNIDGTNFFYKPDNRILPRSMCTLKFEWNFTVSSRHLRMGVYDSTSFFIAFWYPQVSVYDDVDGWDKIDYTGQHEFYNDFCSYDVEITVPNKFAVWATGILQNPQDVFTDEYLKRYKLANQSDKLVKIISQDDLNKKDIFSSKGMFNTWKFKAENVNDFSFATSDHYLWDALSIKADKNSDRRVFISAAYKKESSDFYHVAEISKKSIRYFSDVLPGVPFPYPSLTVFNGGSTGGMEFPMMVNDGSFTSMINTVGTTSHEIAHQYFPFFVGTNERKYAFMDEGMAVMLPFGFQENELEGNFPKARNTYQYENLAGKELDMPPMTPSVLLKKTTYRVASYVKPGLAYYFLREALENEIFDKALREYINRWNGKHPIPFDFFYTFNHAAGKDLDWFWIPWFFEKGYPDLGIKNAFIQKGKLHVIIEKRGSVPVPIKLTILQSDDPESSRIDIDVVYKTAAVWESGEEEYLIEYDFPFDEDKIKIISLGSTDIPDIDTTNNDFIFKRVEDP